MIWTSSHKLNLTSASDKESVTPWVERPPGATELGVYVIARGGWGTGPAATVVVEHAPEGIDPPAGVPFATPISFSADGYALDTTVGTKPRVRARVQTAGGGTPDTAAAVVMVFYGQT